MPSHFYNSHFVVFHHINTLVVGADVLFIGNAAKVVKNQFYMIAAGFIRVRISAAEAGVDFTNVINAADVKNIDIDLPPVPGLGHEFFYEREELRVFEADRLVRFPGAHLELLLREDRM